MPPSRTSPSRLLLAATFAIGVPVTGIGVPLQPAVSSHAGARIPTSLLIRVVDSASGHALPNAEVSTTGGRRLTDTRGEARFPWPSDGTLSLRVRQLGFRYADRTLHRGTSPTAAEDTVVVALARAPFALPQVVTRVERGCPPTKDSAEIALSVSSLELLRFGAQQYNTFRATYPFDVTLARRTERFRRTISSARVRDAIDTTTSEGWGYVYKPGDVLVRNGASYFLPLLFVSSLADSAFLERHCFVAHGVQEREGRREIRLDFTVARGIRDVEWEGAAWLDSAASVLKRVDFRLVNLVDRDGPRELEGYTTFAMPSPYIAVPDTTVAWWRIGQPVARPFETVQPETVQMLTVRSLSYRSRQPPALTAAPVSAPPK